MKTIAYLKLSTAVIFLGSSFLTSCGKDAPVVQEVKSITINPSALEVEIGATAPFTLTVVPEDAAIEYSIDNPDIISRKGKTITALQTGTAILSAKAGNKSATLAVTVKEKVVPESFFLPYLRFFDGKEAILEYEKSIGHTFTGEDATMNSITFSTGNAKIHTITYIVGARLQMFSSREVMQSREFIDFMASKGFKTDGQIKSGVMEYSSDLKTVKAFAIADTIKLSEDAIYPMGMCFASIPPVLAEIPYPLLKWDATPEEIKTFEASRGYLAMPQQEDKLGRTEYTFSKKAELPEYTELFAPKYLFKDGKLVKITLLIAPDGYVITSMGGAFSVHPEFVALAKKDGYIERAIEGSSRKAYVNETTKNKFTIESWTIHLNKWKTNVAGLAFVPFDGPDEIE